jgi:hypothetical protein
VSLLELQKSQEVHLWRMKMKKKSKGKHIMRTLSWDVKTLCSKYHCELKLSSSTNQTQDMLLERLFSSVFNVRVVLP